MKQFSSRLFSDPDVEDCHDFWQYYRGTRRFFGLRLETEIFEPVSLHDRQSDSKTNAMFVMNHAVSGESFAKDFKYISGHAMFGSPMLGNHPFGDSYVVLDKVAVRESAKGLVLNESVSAHVIDPKGFGLSNYAYVAGEESRPRSFHIGPQNFFGNLRTSMVLDTLKHVFNPRYLTVAAALQTMLAGDKLGVPLNHQLGFHFVRGEPEIFVFLRNRKIGVLEDETPDRPTIRMLSPDNYSMLYLQHQFGTDARIVA